MKKAIYNGLAAFIAVVFALRASNADAEALSVMKDMMLTTNAVYDTVSVADGVTLDLNGHTLTTGALSGGGTVMSATQQDEGTVVDGCILLDFVETPSNNSDVFVDTRYKPLCTDRVETKVEFGTTAGNEVVFSSRQNSANNNASAKHLTCFRIGTTLRFDRYNVYGHAKSGTIYTKTLYEIVADFGNLRYTVNDDGPFSTTGGTGEFTAYTNLLLFATGVLNGSTYEMSSFAKSCKMYYFRVYDSENNLKVNLVPAVRDDAVGFYDTVRRIFLAPANGSLFAYRPLNYVQTPANNGAAMVYVDTEYIPLLTDRIETKIHPCDIANFQGVFSARFSTETNTFTCVMASTGAAFKLRFDHHTTNPHVFHSNGTADTTFANDHDYEIVMDGNTLGFSVNGVVSATTLTPSPEDESATPDMTMRLFAVATKGSGHSNYANSCRMYYFRAYGKDGTPKLDLVPARRIPDGLACFYDRVGRRLILPRSPGGNGLIAGSTPPEDLTNPGGRCWSSVKDNDRNTTVTNLFNNNFVNGTSPTARFIVMNIGGSKPAIDYDFGEGNAQSVNMYRIYGGGNNRTPVAWDILGSDTAFGSSDETGWTLLDSRSGEPGWSQSECRTKVFANDTAFRYHRFKVREKGSDAHFEMTQLEYFHVGSTYHPGELHVAVADGAAMTNATVQFGGNMKFVKEGTGAFVSNVSNQFHTGGTDVKAGEFIVAAPLCTAMTVAEGASLGFSFASKNAVPLLTLASGSSMPSSLDVSIYRDGPFALPQGEVTLTSGYDFGDVAVNFVNPSDGIGGVRKDAHGNLVVLGSSGLVIIFR